MKGRRRAAGLRAARHLDRDRRGRDRIARLHARAPRCGLRARAGCAAHVHEHPHHQRLRGALHHGLGRARGDDSRRSRSGSARPRVPGQALRFSGRVEKVSDEGDERVIELAVRAANDLGDHATGTVAARAAAMSAIATSTPTRCARSTARSATSGCAPTASRSTSSSRAGSPTSSDDPWVRAGLRRARRSPTRSTSRVIGGGFGGLLAGARLREPGVESIRIDREGRRRRRHVVLEPLPGLACDVESYVYLPMLEELGYMPVEKYSRGAGDPRALPARSRSRYDLYRDACFQTAVTEIRWDARRVALDHRDRPRRRDPRALRRASANGFAAPKPKLPGRPRHRDVRGPRLPHQPLGLRLHGRRRERRSRPTCTTSASGSSAPAPPRCSASRTWAQRARAPLRVSAHAVVGRRARQPPDRSRVGERPRAGLAAAADRELPGPHRGRLCARGPRERRLDRRSSRKLARVDALGRQPRLSRRR